MFQQLKCRFARLACTLLLPCLVLQAGAAALRLVPVGNTGTTNTIEVRGMGAGPVHPGHWQKNTLHWVEDRQRPLLEPGPGKFRNIYAPSAVEMAGGGWRVYYGGWDGIEQGNDHIYVTTTPDFRSFGPREHLVKPGPFQHICNVNAISDDDGHTSLVCTVYPDQYDRNKPALYSFGAQELQPGSIKAATAGPADIIQMTGYLNYPDADINGMNVLLREGDKTLLYFGNFRDYGKVYRASSTDGTKFNFDGVVLNARLGVNDVKKFRTSGGDLYLMGLHHNGNDLLFSTSADGMQFDKPQRLFPASGDDEKYIVALGWVVQGEQEAPGRKLLGVLYGAGAVPTLDQNRIFARWLQKKLSFAGAEVIATRAAGPDTQEITLRGTDAGTMQISVTAEDGVTPLASGEAFVEPGKIYDLRVK